MRQDCCDCYVRTVTKRASLLWAAIAAFSVSACGSGSGTAASATSAGGSTTSAVATTPDATPEATKTATTGSTDTAGSSCPGFAIKGGPSGASIANLGVIGGADCATAKTLASNPAVRAERSSYEALGYHCENYDPSSADRRFACEGSEGKGVVFVAVGIT